MDALPWPNHLASLRPPAPKPSPKATLLHPAQCLCPEKGVPRRTWCVVSGLLRWHCQCSAISVTRTADWQPLSSDPNAPAHRLRLYPPPFALCSSPLQTPSLYFPIRKGSPHPALWQARRPQKVESKGRVVRWFWPLLGPAPSCGLPGAWDNGRGVGSKPGKEDVRTQSKGGSEGPHP